MKSEQAVLPNPCLEEEEESIFHKIYIMYKASCQSQALESKLCLTLKRYVIMAAQFKPLILFVDGIALS
jgi:hypothetical protein